LASKNKNESGFVEESATAWMSTAEVEAAGGAGVAVEAAEALVSDRVEGEAAAAVTAAAATGFAAAICQQRERWWL
jgi:hypothetical protein